EALLRTLGLLRAERLHVNVRAQPRVIGDVPAIVIGILVDHDLVRVPQPIAAERVVERRHAEEEAAEPKACRTTARQSKQVAIPEAATEAAVLVRTIEMKSFIV